VSGNTDTGIVRAALRDAAGDLGVGRRYSGGHQPTLVPGGANAGGAVSDESPWGVGEFTLGSQIASYRLEEQIGRGGMAVVYRARDVRLDRSVALKILAPALARDQAFRQRFMRESRAAAAVDHPNIVPIFEAGEAGGAGGVLFIAMRYVRGRDLRTLIDTAGALPAARVASIVAQMASALDAAHSHGLVHRDVKPANMLLAAATGSDQPDHVYLSDFGLSKRSLAGAGQFLGTLDYVAPEQIEGRPVDGAGGSGGTEVPGAIEAPGGAEVPGGAGGSGGTEVPGAIEAPGGAEVPGGAGGSGGAEVPGGAGGSCDALLGFSAAKLRSDPAHALIARVEVGETPIGLTFIGHGKRIIVADSNLNGLKRATSSLAVVDTAAALAGRPSLLGLVSTGLLPRQFTVEPNGKALLVTNSDSRQLQAVAIADLP
jgi:Protein kinase domain